MTVVGLVREADVLSPVDTLLEVAQSIEEGSAGAVVVVDGGDLVGIITSRDLARAASDEVGFELTRIEEYMTDSPVTVKTEADEPEALRAMLEGGFDHLPVLDADGDVKGVITLGDVAKVLAKAPSSKGS